MRGGTWQQLDFSGGGVEAYDLTSQRKQSLSSSSSPRLSCKVSAHATSTQTANANHGLTSTIDSLSLSPN